LVDSGCTGEAFVDYAFAVRIGLPLTKLEKKRPLFLADGKLARWIEYGTRATLQIGSHSEELDFFVTTLAENHPVILGLPWLRNTTRW
jgi:predicted aspartyl protease